MSQSLANLPTHRFRAMGCGISFWLAANATTAVSAFAAAEALFHQNEAALSRFRPESELCQLNGRSQQWVVVSDLLWGMLTRSLTLAAETGGLFDPTLLNELEAAGYTRSFDQMPAVVAATPPAPPENGRWAAVRLDAATQSVWLPAHTRLDLGGIAKGVTAQQAAALLAQHGACLVDAGGDVTAGDAPADFPGWPVAIADPFSDDGNLLQLWLTNATLATSGIDYRRWQQNGRWLHHLIDPRTGQPADTNLVTVSVLADDAAEAEVWATAALVGGDTDGYELLMNRQLAGVLVGDNGRWRTTPNLNQFNPKD